MERIPLDPREPEAALLARAAQALARGLLVAYPTETFYGLAADPTNPAAVQRIFAAKGRPASSALPLIAADLDQVSRVGRPSEVALRLARRFWPGPLALIVEATPVVDPVVHGGLATIAIRVPGHAVASGLAAAAAMAITATSANRSGEAPPTTADEVIRTFGAEIAIVLDGGETPGGLPSTIVDATSDPPQLVRPGAVPWARVLEFLAT